MPHCGVQSKEIIVLVLIRHNLSLFNFILTSNEPYFINIIDEKIELIGNQVIFIMFGITPQFQQPQAFPQMNPSPQIQAEQMHFQSVASNFKTLNDWKGHPDLQILLILLKYIQDDNLNCLNQVVSQGIPLDQNPSSSVGRKEVIVGRFKTIKQKNNQLLIKTLNLREKMINQMYMCKIRSPHREVEMDTLNQRIRSMRMKINNRCSQLKYIKLTKNLIKPNHSKKVSGNSIGYFSVLEQIKKGAQIIEKQAFRLKEEVGLLIKYLHGEQI